MEEEIKKKKRIGVIGIVIVIIIYVVVMIGVIKVERVRNEELKKKIEEDDKQIKELIIENRDLRVEYNKLVEDNEENIKQIEWLNEQMVILRGE